VTLATLSSTFLAADLSVSSCWDLQAELGTAAILLVVTDNRVFSRPALKSLYLCVSSVGRRTHGIPVCKKGARATQPDARAQRAQGRAQTCNSRKKVGVYVRGRRARRRPQREERDRSALPTRARDDICTAAMEHTRALTAKSRGLSLTGGPYIPREGRQDER